MDEWVRAHFEKCELSELTLVSRLALTMPSHAKEISFFPDQVVCSGTCCSRAGWQYLNGIYRQYLQMHGLPLVMALLFRRATRLPLVSLTQHCGTRSSRCRGLVQSRLNYSGFELAIDQSDQKPKWRERSVTGSVISSPSFIRLFPWDL